MGREVAPVKGSAPPPAVVVVTLAVVVVPLAVVVVPFTVVVVAPEVLVAPLVVVPLTVVVVAPEVVVAPDVLVAPLVVVPFTVVVVAPPVVVADASCPTLTPASTSRATMISQAAGRLDAFFTCLAIDPYLLLSARPCWSCATYRTNETAACFCHLGQRRRVTNARLAAATDRSV